MLRNLNPFIVLLILGLFVLSACGGNDEVAAPAPTPTAVAVEATSTPEIVVTQPPGETTEAAEPTIADPAPEEPTALAEETSVEPEEILTNTKLNLNTAEGPDFQAAIPNFGNRMVREFLEYRPYISIQQFRREIGKYVDEAQVAAYEQYVYVPVNIDEADAATLQQLPGVDETIAADLIAARPYGSTDAFLAKLAEYVSEAEVAVAPSYLAAP